MRTLALLAASIISCAAGLALAADVGPALVPATPVVAKVDPNAGVVLDPVAFEVWTTDKGTKYHTKDCTNAKVKTTLASAVVDGDTPCATCHPAVYDAAKIAVFTTANGKKYHLYNCRIIAGKASTQVTLPAAVKDAFEPCGVCHPPVVWTAAGPATAAPAR